jgi:Tfp pilus assembly protein PilX
MGEVGRKSLVHDERGIALLTVVMVMIMVTVLGIAAITASSLENKMAGTQRTTESAAVAAESCLGTAVNIIQETMLASALPAAFQNGPSPNNGPVPQGNAATLQSEIMGGSDNNADAPGVNMVQNNVGGYTVKGDIDRLYTKAKAGGSLQFAAGYEGIGQGSGGGGIEILYGITCVAENTATGTSSKVSAVFACMSSGENCQRKI